MDLGSAIIGMVLIAICVLPFVWMHRIKKAGENKLLKALSELAAGKGCAASKQQVFRDFAIGMDENKGYVFFYKKSNEEEVSACIDLAGTRTCKVVNTSSSFNTHDGARKVTEKLELVFAPVADNTPTVALEFYDMYKNVQLSGELQLIEIWADRISEWLKKVK